MSTPSSALPVSVDAALDDIENSPPVSTAPASPPRDRTDDVVRHLHRQVSDPVTRALLSRPVIVAWSVAEAIDQAVAARSATGSPSVRRAAPLVARPSSAATVDESPGALADRVGGIVEPLHPDFLRALVSHVGTEQKLKITAAERDLLVTEVPSAARGHSAAELDVVVGTVLAEHRATRARDTVLGTFGYPPSTPSTGPAWSALPIDDPGGSDTPPSTCDELCAVAETSLTPVIVNGPTALISTEYVTAAAVLAAIHQYGDRIGFFRAVDEALTQLDGDRLCVVGNPALLNLLNCWPERHYRITARERATLAAKVLGIRDPTLPDGIRPDPVIPGLFDNLLTAINAFCDPGPFRSAPSPATSQRLESAATAVLVRLSSTVTGRTTLRVRELQVQFGTALEILRGLSKYVHAPCRPDLTTPVPDEWTSVSALLGTQLRDGTDLVQAAETAAAWSTVVNWLADPQSTLANPTDEVCLAAALLRPYPTDTRSWPCRTEQQEAANQGEV